MKSTSNDLIVIALGSNLRGNFPGVEALLDAGVAALAAAGTARRGREASSLHASHLLLCVRVLLCPCLLVSVSSMVLVAAATAGPTGLGQRL